MRELFNELEQLAKDWRKLSYKYSGGYCKEYLKEGYRVWVYFNRNQDHTAVSFEDGASKDIQVSFFDPCHFSLGKRFTDESVLKSTIEKYKEYLVEIAKELEQNEINEAEENKKSEIQELEKRLSELKNEKLTEEQLIEREKVSGFGVTKDSTIL